MKFAWLSFTANLVFTTVLLAGPQVSVSRLLGEPLEGELQAIDPTQLVVNVAGVEQAVELADVLQIDFANTRSAEPAAARERIELADGSRITGTVFTWLPPDANLQGTEAEPMRLPSEAVTAVRWGNAAALSKRWNELRSEPRSTDLLVVYRQERTALEGIEGVVEEVTAKTVEFKLDGEPLSAPREKVFGILFVRSEANAAAAAPIKLTSTGGEILLPTSVELEAEELIATTAWGFSRRLRLSDLKRLDYSAGKVLYLSEIDSLQLAWNSPTPAPPNLSAKFDLNDWALARDESLLSGPLMLPSDDKPSSRRFRRGLSLRAGVTATFARPAEFSRLRATVAIDPGAAEVGDTELIIQADGAELQRISVTGTQVTPLDVELGACQQLTLIVEAGDSPTGDIVNLGDARFSK
jgi:hypothetical protein